MYNYNAPTINFSFNTVLCCKCLFRTHKARDIVSAWVNGRDPEPMVEAAPQGEMTLDDVLKLYTEDYVKESVKTPGCDILSR